MAIWNRLITLYAQSGNLAAPLLADGHFEERIGPNAVGAADRPRSDGHLEQRTRSPALRASNGL